MYRSKANSELETRRPSIVPSRPTGERLVFRVHLLEPMPANVSAVYEVPELTDRSAEGFPRPLMIDTFHGLPWQGREAAAA